ncbi:MAG: hypothetical protein JNL94_03060 [Planctomycetes bacterium]|nr:hypothetical protein [Planctomycetota bacterium]
MLQLATQVALLVVGFASTPGSVEVVLLEPLAAATDHAPPRFTRVVDAARIETIHGWLEHPCARRALALYAMAADVRAARDPAYIRVPYPIALVPGGNHADAGYIEVATDGTETTCDVPFIKLDPSAEAFGRTFLHESGHVALGIVAGARGIPAEPVASIPHTVTAITDRSTAFNEGYAIHLEAIAVHLGEDAGAGPRDRHERMVFGSDRPSESEYFRPAVDFASYAQPRARYRMVRDGEFAFAPASQCDGYLRAQLDPARDGASLLNADQMVASEGFAASSFFAFVMRGPTLPDAATIDARERRMLEAAAEMFATRSPDPSAPLLVDWWTTLLRSADAADVRSLADVVLDRCHGAFVDADAARLWRSTYTAALTLDLGSFAPAELKRARANWRDRLVADPGLLASRLGAVVPFHVPDVEIAVVAFGGAAPLSFDVNTATEGVMRSIPEITADDVTRWSDERARQPFTSADDFLARVAKDTAFAAKLRPGVPN